MYACIYVHMILSTMIYIYIYIFVSNQSDGIRETLPGTLIFIQETQDSVCSDGPSQH